MTRYLVSPRSIVTAAAKIRSDSTEDQEMVASAASLPARACLQPRREFQVERALVHSVRDTARQVHACIVGNEECIGKILAISRARVVAHQSLVEVKLQRELPCVVPARSGGVPKASTQPPVLHVHTQVAPLLEIRAVSHEVPVVNLRELVDVYPPALASCSLVPGAMRDNDDGDHPAKQESE